MAQMDTQIQRAPAGRLTVAPRYPGQTARASLPWPVAIYLLCVVIPIGFNAGPVYMTTLRLFLLIVTVPLMIQILTGRHGKVLITDVLFAAHILWAGVALFVNNPGQMVQQVGSVGVEFLGGYAVGRAFIKTPEDFRGLCRWLVFIICASLPFVLLESQTGRPLVLEIIRGLPAVSTLADVHADPRLGLQRSQFTFAHPIHYGLFCSVALSLTFVALRRDLPDISRYILTAVIAFCGFLALSSGAILAILFQIGFIVWAALFSNVASRWWILIALTSVAYIVVEVLSDRSAVMVFLSYASFSAHNAYWRTIIFEWGMINVWANPVFGLGLNDWVRPSFMFSGSMDNFWLVMAVRYGIPGFLFLAIGYAIPLGRILLRDFSKDPAVNQLRLAWVFTFLGITFVLCTVHVWGNLYSFVFFVFGAGLWMLSHKPREDEDATQETDRDPRPGFGFTRFPEDADPPPAGRFDDGAGATQSLSQMPKDPAFARHFDAPAPRSEGP